MPFFFSHYHPTNHRHQRLHLHVFLCVCWTYLMSTKCFTTITYNLTFHLYTATSLVLRCLCFTWVPEDLAMCQRTQLGLGIYQILRFFYQTDQAKVAVFLCQGKYKAKTFTKRQTNVLLFVISFIRVVHMMLILFCSLDCDVR